MSDATQAPAVRRFGAFEINLRAGELRKNGMRLRLSGQPFQILAVLTERPGELVTREELHSKLWRADTFVDFDHGLNNAVNRIREVLDDSSDTPRYIETIPRRGYRFIAPVTEVGLSAAAEAQSSGAAPGRVSAAPFGASPVASSGTSSGSARFSSRAAVLLAGLLLLAIFAVGVAFYRGHNKPAKQPSIRSLAVLPLENLSGDPTQEYLADGLTEELIGRLAAIHNLRVVSRTSVMQFRGTKKAVPEIGKTLGVDAIVEGSVMRDGNRIRVHAQLIRAATDEHFWSETYDRELQDVLTLESEVAQSIAEKVEVTASGEEHQRLANARSVSPEVYEAYLKGRFSLSHYKNRGDIEKSIQYFEEATQRDPTFAPAYASLANAYLQLRTILIGDAPAPLTPKIMNAARKALELDPELVDAHLALADLQEANWQWAEAGAEYKRAIELNPNNAAAHLAMAMWLLSQGRTGEALEWARRGRELDPFAVSGDDLSWILFCSHHYDEAIRELRSALSVSPDDPGVLWHLGYSLIASGHPEQAIPFLEKAVEISNRGPGPIGVLIRAYAHAGRTADALRLLEELKRRSRTGYIPAAAFVNAYLGLGDNQNALLWLDTACDEHSNIIQFLKVHPHFDPLRNDPHFVRLVHRVGLDHAE